MHIFYKDVCELQVLYFPNDVWYAIWNRKVVGACDAPSPTFDRYVILQWYAVASFHLGMNCN